MSPKPYDLIKELTPKLGEKEARDLVEFVEERSEERLKELVTKADLGTELLALRTDLEKQIQALRTELKTEIQSLRVEIQAVRFDLLKWLFGFWITLLLVIIFKEYFLK